jgi:dCMP deaminase
MNGPSVELIYHKSNIDVIPLLVDEVSKIIKWDLWFLGLAKYISTASKDPSTRVGSVIIDQNRRTIAMGFNGFPKGIYDNPELLNNREEKKNRVIHAEINAILFAKQDLTNCTLFTYPFISCSRCAVHVIQVGIKRVVGPKLDITRVERWGKDIELSKQLFDEAGVEVVEYEMEITND